jgi:hypothetical protein
MFQLDDNFLNDVGLGVLPDDQKQAFLQHVYEELEMRVGTSLSDGLSEQQMREFESFIDQDAEKVPAWLAANVPDFASRADYTQMAAGAPAGTPEIALQSEYGSLKWLELNRPDYRDVVARELEKLKGEIAGNKDAIIGGATA